ncbi:hypothetical protein CPC08DRAFT_237598 [Agrocybe pediades]|nr:hypothetical protein CPC08DRAFT_237598 [Agrocybe pediades]
MGLRDSNFLMKNTQMVLTHFTLNDVVEVRVSLERWSKYLEDPGPSGLGNLLLKEMSTKDHAIYDDLFDVISYLSTGIDHAVDEQVC